MGSIPLPQRLWKPGWLALWSSCWLAAAVVAQEPSDYLLDIWDTENKLPSSTVTDIAQSSDGYLWIGTYNGLARFDGVRFVTFDPINTPALGHARVQSLTRDEAGTLWINTYLGELTSYRDGQFRREWDGRGVYDSRTVLARSSAHELVFVTTTEILRRTIGGATTSAWEVTSAPARSRFQCADQAGNLWFLSREGRIIRFTGEEAIELSADQAPGAGPVSTVVADSLGTVWSGSTQGLHRWDGVRFVPMNPTNAPVQEANLLLPTRDGGMWVWGQNRLRKALGGRWLTDAAEWEGLLGYASGRVMGMHEDRGGGVWFNHYGNGIFHVRPDGSRLRLTTQDGLPGDRVGAWFQTPEGDIWLGVDHGGLVRLRDRQFEVIGPSQGLRARGVLSVCADAQNNIFIGTAGGGLTRLSPEGLDHFDVGSSGSENLVFSILPRRHGGLLLSASSGEEVHLFDDLRITRAPWDFHGVKAMIEDRHGRIWIGTKSSLAWVTLTNGAIAQRRVFGAADGVAQTSVRAFAEAVDGTIWCGADDGSIYRCQPDRLERFRATDALASQPVFSLAADADGNVWAGTFRGGLLRLQSGRFTRLGPQQGLPSDNISQILEDSAGHLWLGTDQGICRVEKRSLNRCADRLQDRADVVMFGRLDGLPTLECASGYQPSCWRGGDGRLWFATVKGAVAVRPNELSINPVPPPVLVEEFRVDGALADLTPHRGKLPPGHRQFEFRFTALSFSAPDKVRFRYRLEGLDEEWTEAENRRTAQYSHLGAGHYRFHVTACNNDGLWNETGTTLAFTVLPRFYQTWWFIGLVSVLLVGGVAGLVRAAAVRKYRRKLAILEQQNAIERDRARIARDIHDDLGAGLTQITLLSELARRDPPEKTPAHLDAICGSARHLTRTMDEIVWAVDPQHDTLSGFVDYASAFAEDFLRLAGVRCRWDLPVEVPPHHLEAEQRYHLFLAFKEALNNIVKHAHATEVQVRLRLDPRAFELELEDNGQGLPGPGGKEPAAGERKSGRGLGNLGQRLEGIGGTCRVESASGTGTRVVFRLALAPTLSALRRGQGEVSHSVIANAPVPENHQAS